MKTFGNEKSGAIFSNDMNYRYRLWRVWDPNLPRACFCLLNPSKADHIIDDATVQRQTERVRRWRIRGRYPFPIPTPMQPFGAIEVVNACAWISTNPDVLQECDDPVGDDNGGMIRDATTMAVESGGVVVCGWGSNLTKLYLGKYPIHQILTESLVCDRIPLCALKLNPDGTPRHPLYVGYEVLPRYWYPCTIRADSLGDQAVMYQGLQGQLIPMDEGI